MLVDRGIGRFAEIAEAGEDIRDAAPISVKLCVLIPEASPPNMFVPAHRYYLWNWRGGSLSRASRALDQPPAPCGPGIGSFNFRLKTARFAYNAFSRLAEELQMPGKPHLALSRRGVSYSFGGRGLWLTVGPGHSRTSVGVPSTGLYWYQQRRFPPPANDDVTFLSLLPRPHRYDWLAVAGIAAVILTMLALIWR
jgi:hypothetical protein